MTKIWKGNKKIHNSESRNQKTQDIQKQELIQRTKQIQQHDHKLNKKNMKANQKAQQQKTISETLKNKI